MGLATIIIIAIAVVAVVAIGFYAWQRHQSQALAVHYGPEYERVVSETGSRQRGEAELRRREERLEHLDIRPLSAQQQSEYQRQWRATQARFVDDPAGAIGDADVLVEDVMKTRGYPVSDFDQRAADLSVHHPRVVDNYRAARDIARRHRRGDATTEDLRMAMVYYRGLFDDLLEDREHGVAGAERAVERPIERSVDRAAGVERAADRGIARPDDRAIRNDGEVRP
jgi:hypothetical protein